MQHLNCYIGNRRTWQDGEGFIRGPYHVYAKDDDLAKGYRGYRHASRRPGANAKYLKPSALVPHLRSNAPNLVAMSKHFLRPPNTRRNLRNAMRNEIAIPRRFPRLQAKPQGNLGSFMNEAPLLPQKSFTSLVESWQSGLLKNPKPRNSRGTRDGKAESTRTQEAVQAALESGDSAVVNWAIAHFQQSKDMVTTLEGRLRPQRSSFTSRKSSPQSRARTNAVDPRTRYIQAGAVMAARAILKAHHEQRALLARDRATPSDLFRKAKLDLSWAKPRQGDINVQKPGPGQAVLSPRTKASLRGHDLQNSGNSQAEDRVAERLPSLEDLMKDYKPSPERKMSYFGVRSRSRYNTTSTSSHMALHRLEEQKDKRQCSLKKTSTTRQALHRAGQERDPPFGDTQGRSTAPYKIRALPNDERKSNASKAGGYSRETTPTSMPEEHDAGAAVQSPANITFRRSPARRPPGDDAAPSDAQREKPQPRERKQYLTFVGSWLS